jgi:glyoxylase-like metal-dependent hydrolase (beta-lactamase superfamily II)
METEDHPTIAYEMDTIATPALRLDYPCADPPPSGGTLEVAPGIQWLRMPLPFALDHINLWLLADGTGSALVDCGYGDDATRELWEHHFATTFADRPLRRIIATHYHPDHVGNAEWLCRRWHCMLAMTHAEFMTAHAAADQRSGYEVDRVVGLFQHHGMAREHVEALRARGNAYRHGVPSLPASFQRLVDGEVVTIDGRGWQIIEGRGHSPEHVSLYSSVAGVLIAGDMLLPRISTNISVWAVEPEGDPLRDFLESIGRFESLPADTLVLPSHGLPFRGIALRVAELRAHHDARLRELEQAVSERGPSSAADLVPVLFRRELDLQQRFFAMGEAIAHLNHLWHAGRLRRVVSGDNHVLFTPLSQA